MVKPAQKSRIQHLLGLAEIRRERNSSRRDFQRGGKARPERFDIRRRSAPERRPAQTGWVPFADVMLARWHSSSRRPCRHVKLRSTHHRN
jgi:hypothetical protein